MDGSDAGGTIDAEGSSAAPTFRLAFIKTAIRFCCCGAGSAGNVESEGIADNEESIDAEGTEGMEGGREGVEAGAAPPN